MEEQLAASLGEGQVFKLIEDDEVTTAHLIGDVSLTASAGLGLKLVDQIDCIEEAPPGAAADAGTSDRDGEVGLAGAGAAEQDDVALMGKEVTACEVAHQGLVDRRAIEDELVDVLGQRQLGDGDLVLDRPGLLLRDLGGEKVADDALRLVLALDGGGDDLVISRLHAVELQLVHRRQDLGSLHHRFSSMCHSGRNRRSARPGAAAHPAS